VEHESQLSCLRTLGCDEYQGYHRSRPLPRAEFEQLLRQTKNGIEPVLESGTTDF
jgi:EAL domain-containing protein (putative c-di-GMP-specific phosphodiesterase class I)